MRITIEKSLMPQLITSIDGIKRMEEFQFDGYDQNNIILTAPSSDIVLNVAMDIARISTVEAYEYWVEIPNANLADDLPAGMSYSTYLDEFEVEQNRTWAELSELQANFAATATMRYWQPANNGQFVFEDVEILIGNGFSVFGHQTLQIQLNKDYADTGDPEYVVTETIEWIDQNWRYGGYFDILDAYFAMGVLYTAKGASDLDRWNGCTTAEKIIIVKWNHVGLNRAADLAPGGWSEGKTLKELSRLYREFNANMINALGKRFSDWHQYLQLTLSGAGRTKYDGDWDWDLQQEYIMNGTRFYELGSNNALIAWHDTILATYLDADFVGTTLTAAQIVASLRSVLIDPKYFI